MTRIARASLIIAIFFGFDKILGLVRQVLFSRLFTENELDIFLTSNNIPDLLSALISGGALGVALIPVLTEYLEKHGRPEAWKLFSRIANLAFIVTAVISLVIILLAEPLIRNFIAPGFDPAKQALTASLMRLDLLAILIFSISGLVMAGLQANQHFLFPAMAPALYNIGQIAGALILAPEKGIAIGPLTLPAFGLGIRGLVFGVIIGAALHLAIQIPGLLKFGFRWSPSLNFLDKGVLRVLGLMAPRVASMFCLHLYFLTRDSLASHLPEGSVTILNYGWFIMQVPETLIGTAIAIALLPSLAEHIVRQDAVAFRDMVNRALRAMLALCLPAAALLSVGIQPLVAVVFDFSPENTLLLAWVSRAFLLGLIGHAWLEVGVRSWYAKQNALIPFSAAALQFVFYRVLAQGLVDRLGVGGLALADTLTFTGEALLLLVWLNFHHHGALDVGRTLLRGLLAAGIGALVTYGVMTFVPLPALPLSLGALTLGGLAALPLIWPEVKMLVKL